MKERVYHAVRHRHKPHSKPVGFFPYVGMDDSQVNCPDCIRAIKKEV